MKINIEAELGGEEILEHFCAKLNQEVGIREGDSNQLIKDKTMVKVFVFSEKANKEVEIKPETIRFVFKNK